MIGTDILISDAGPTGLFHTQPIWQPQIDVLFMRIGAD